MTPLAVGFSVGVAAVAVVAAVAFVISCKNCVNRDIQLKGHREKSVSTTLAQQNPGPYKELQYDSLVTLLPLKDHRNIYYDLADTVY